MSDLYRRSVDLLEAELGNELVGLDVAAGTCFGFNDVATWIWRRMAQPTDFAAIHAALIEEYEVDPEECARDLRELLADLEYKGLITRA